jgi:hypothetical protein
MVIANILGIFLFFYLIWRNLKEDYHYEKVFNLGFIGLSAFLLANFVSHFIKGPFWFWILILFLLLGFLIVVKKQRMKFFETIEAYFVGLMPWIGLFYLADSVNKLSLASFVAFWITFILIFIYFYVRTHYRSFSWYKSGRIGFAGLFTLLLFFLSRVIGSLFYNNLVTMAGKYEVYLSGSASLLILVLMYNLFKEND